MFRKEPQNKKRRANTPRKNRKAPTAKGIHQKRTRTAAFFGLLVGTLICAVLIQTESWTPEHRPLQLTVEGTEQVRAVAETAGDAKTEKEEYAFQGPERVIDVSKIHPALGEIVDGKKVQQLPDAHKVTFTINPKVQQVAEKILADADVPYGALVAVNPKNGKLIAFADYQSNVGLHTGFALEATQPAASIFKVISSAALMESAGISPEKTVCYHGGKSKITKRELTPNKKKDHICRSLSDALAHSSNVVFARLADKHLNPLSLTDWGQRFGFNKPIPFLWTVQESRVDLPSDRVKFAGSAAGFHHTTLSPLHGALLTAAVGNEGMMPMPHLVERIERDGIEIYSAEAKNIGKAISPSTASQLTKMMVKTTSKGTGAKYFNKRHKILKGVNVAGKTGSLSSTIGGKRRHNSWFVAYAPADDPEIALAALVVNDPKWKIKGTYLGREVLEAFFLNK